MKAFLVLIVLGVIVLGLMLVRGGGRRPGTEELDPPDMVASIAQWLMMLLEAHDIEAVLGGNEVVVPAAQIRFSGAVTRVIQHSAVVTVQLDIYVRTADGDCIVESFGCVGKDVETAAKQAVGYFMLSSFHVLRSAYLAEDDDQTVREEWTIADKRRTAHLGGITIRGKYPEEDRESNFWYPALRELIQSQDLPGGTHWVRLFYAQFGNKPHSCEVLLDNDTWVEAQDVVASLDWPKAEEYYSVRLFMILEEKREEGPRE